MKLNYLLLFWLLPVCLLPAGEPPAGPSRHVLDVWKSERGLPSNSVFAMTQDRSGYLWLGTQDGLARFDGKSFSLFARANTPAIRDDLIKTLYLDRSETLWIGSYMGELVSLCQREFRMHRFGKRDVSRPIYCLVEDRRSNLWIGTNSGLFYRPAGDDDRFFEIPGFAGKKIMGIVEDGSGRLWVGTATNGLYRLEQGRWRHLPLSGSGAEAGINTLCLFRDGRVWIGARNGLYGIQGEAVVHLALGRGLSDNIICLLEDRRGDLWAGTENGLYRIANQKAGMVADAWASAGGLIYSLCEDSEGSLWVGTLGGGLIQMRDARFTFFFSPQGPGNEMARCLHEDESGFIWAGGTSGYLGRYNDDRFQEVILPSRRRNDDVQSLERDRTDSLWVGTSAGLLRFHGGALQTVPRLFPQKDIDVRCVLSDRRDRLWVAAWGQGLACRSPGGKNELFTSAAGLGDDRINCLLEDRLGNLWIGSESGVRVARPGAGMAFRPRLALGGCKAMSAYEDGNGAVWIGTFNHGLKVHKAGRWGSVTVDQGLFDNRVYAILEDAGDHLWLTSERGIFMAKKTELENAAFDPRQQVRGRLFDESDGLSSRVCNSGSPAAWKDKAERMWFATLKGVALIDPTRMRRNEMVPPVLVEEMVVDNRSLPTSGNSPAAPLQLPAGSKRFEFKYTALSFIRSEKIAFKYKLEGYDKEWTSAGGRREAFYNDLRPGRYNFRVIAANADGVWNMAGASFAFFLRPFVYQTWWFMVLAALAFSILSVLLWQLLKRYLHAVTFWKKKTHIGHFKILETIGTGGMATVYKAQDLLDKDRIVALKVLKEENFHDENAEETLQARVADHRAARPPAHRAHHRARRNRRLLVHRHGAAARAVAGPADQGRGAAGDGLGHRYHAAGHRRPAGHPRQDIVHRDLKPENIMVSERRGRRHYVKLLDFGLAITPAQSRLTMSGVVMGTIRYLPPERISDGTSSPAGDIYSAGIILYEMLTGSKPFWSEATGEVINSILKTYPLPPREISHEVPRELNALIMAMIDKDPAKRPAWRPSAPSCGAWRKNFPRPKVLWNRTVDFLSDLTPLVLIFRLD